MITMLKPFVAKSVAVVLALAGALAITPVANATLIGLYTYDNAANLGQDHSGNNNHLIHAGAATTGVYGGGLNLNGTNALFSASGTLVGLPTGNSSYTITSWFNPTFSGSRGIIGWGTYGQYNSVNAIRMHHDNSLYNYWWGNDLYGTTPSSLTAGNGSAGWHFVAATYDAATGLHQMSVDGTLVASRQTSGLNATGVNFAIGKSYANEYFYGQLDNTAIFNTALTNAQLRTVSLNDFSAFTANSVSAPAGMALFTLSLAAVALRRRQGKRAELKG